MHSWSHLNSRLNPESLSSVYSPWCFFLPEIHRERFILRKLASGEREQKDPQTFALETYARRSFNYCNRMVDKDGLPYFNIFWTEPAEAAHDWPDFGDGMPRQFQAVVMARHMTGETLPIEAVWRQKILNLIDPETGFLTRPQTNFSKRVADEGDQGLVLYALATAYADKPDEELKKVIIKIVDGLLDHAQKGTLDNKSFHSRIQP